MLETFAGHGSFPLTKFNVSGRRGETLTSLQKEWLMPKRGNASGLQRLERSSRRRRRLEERVFKIP